MEKISLTKEAQEARREYFREYRRKNPEKIAAANARHWAKVAEKLKNEREGSDCSGK